MNADIVDFSVHVIFVCWIAWQSYRLSKAEDRIGDFQKARNDQNRDLRANSRRIRQRIRKLENEVFREKPF